jgi:hypothetical protein
MEKYGKAGQAQLTPWRTRIACWIPKATNTHSKHVILIVFPLKKWLHQSALMLRDTLVAFVDTSPQLLVACRHQHFGENYSLHPQCTKSANRKHYMI